MQDDKLKDIFKNLEGHFDTEEPVTGHELRFLEKLNIETKELETKSKQSNWWKILSIAASIALLFIVGIAFINTTVSIEEQVAEISPEAANTQFYFANLIEEQVKLLESENSPETQQIISDTMEQLKKLELNYSKLESELVKDGNSKLILSAMITNFQTRIDLLEEVLGQIELIKSLNNNNDFENQSIL